MEKRILKIRDRSKKIYFNNREIRTPVEIDVSEQNIKELELKMRIVGITDYEIETIVEDGKAVVTTPIEIKENDNVVVEELDQIFEEDSSTLHRFANMKDEEE